MLGRYTESIWRIQYIVEAAMITPSFTLRFLERDFHRELPPFKIVVPLAFAEVANSFCVYTFISMSFQKKSRFNLAPTHLFASTSTNTALLKVTDCLIDHDHLIKCQPINHLPLPIPQFELKLLSMTYSLT